MLYFQRPWLLVLVLAALLPLLRRRPRPWRYPPLAVLGPHLRAPRLRRVLLLLTRSLAVALTAVALAGPRLPRAPIPEVRPTRNIFILLDISRSMLQRDFPSADAPVQRFEAARGTVRQFLMRHESDRVGVIAFGPSAFTVVPLTRDHGVAAHLLEDLRPTVVGDKTAIGDALMLALARLRPVRFRSSLIILVTDGRNTAGEVDPRRAAAAAEQVGVPIFSIGIGKVGAPGGVDIELLRLLAEKTGGRSFVAARQAVLEAVVADIERIEQSRVEEPRRRPRHLESVFALAALLFLLTELAVSATIARTVPFGL